MNGQHVFTGHGNFRYSRTRLPEAKMVLTHLEPESEKPSLP